MIGPWVRHGESYASLADDDEVLRVGVERAAALIPEKEVWVSRSRVSRRPRDTPPSLAPISDQSPSNNVIAARSIVVKTLSRCRE